MASRALQNADQIARENVGFADGVLRAKEGPCGWQREQMSQSTVNDKRASGVASPSSDRRTLVASGGIPPGSPPASLDKKSLTAPVNWTKKVVSPASPKKEAGLTKSIGTAAGMDLEKADKLRESGSTEKSKRKSMKGLFSRKKKAKTIVCVDSDTAVLEQLTKILEELSFFPMCFTSSTDAKEFLGEQAGNGSVAMVISSMMMPGLSGMQLLQEARASSDEVTKAMPFLLLSSFSKGATKMQEFQIKTSDGGTVDILIKPLVSGLLVKKIRELTDKEKPDAASPSAKKKDKAKNAKSPQSDRKDKNDVVGAVGGSSSASLSASMSATQLAGAKDGTRKSKSTPHIADVGFRSEGALPSSPGVSFALLGAPRDVTAPTAAATSTSGGDRDSGRARSRTMSSSGQSPLGARLTRESGAPAPAKGHARKSSDPLSMSRTLKDPADAPASSAETFLDTVFSGGSVPTGNKNSAGPNWDELESEGAAHSSVSKVGRRKTIHGISKKKPI